MKMLDTDGRLSPLNAWCVSVLLIAAQKVLATSNQELAADLQKNEAIASLRKPDGTLDMDRYRQLLAGQACHQRLRRRFDKIHAAVTRPSRVVSGNCGGSTVIASVFERQKRSGSI
jgi:hypothetical protein